MRRRAASSLLLLEGADARRRIAEEEARGIAPHFFHGLVEVVRRPEPA
jgi:hypothetical protein